MLIEILNKEQFLEAVKKDPSLLIVTDTRINNEGQETIFFSRCSEPFTMDEYEELCKEHIHDLEAIALRAEQMVENNAMLEQFELFKALECEHDDFFVRGNYLRRKFGHTYWWYCLYGNI